MTAWVVAVLVGLAAAIVLVPGRRGTEREPERAAGAGWSGRRRWSPRDRRRRRREAEDVLGVLDALVPALHAGLPPAAALRLVGASGGPAEPGDARPAPGGDPERGDVRPPLGLAALADAAGRGEAVGSAWAAYADDLGSDDLRLVAGGWSLCDRLGAPLAPTLATVTAAVRRRRESERRVATALAGPRATMRVLTVLPLCGPLVALAVGVSPTDLYLQPAGTAALVAGLVLLAVGRGWASAMTRAVTVERAPRGGRWR